MELSPILRLQYGSKLLKDQTPIFAKIDTRNNQLCIWLQTLDGWKISERQEECAITV
jgi:hypothetical protein